MPAPWVVTAHGLGIMDDLQGVLCTRGIKRGQEGSQSKRVHVLDNPELNLDLLLSKIITI